jgi:hypothetical protein
MTPIDRPQLAAPGAGLPAPELFIARVLFRLRRLFSSHAGARLRFQRERNLIRMLAGQCSPESGTERVLIRRVPGLEDSSRFWSVWMTLDHLRIVNGEMARVIRALTSGIMPEGTASTAAVKPSPDAKADVVPAYEQSCDALPASVAGSASLRTQLRFAHPWFGPMDAAGWHVLAGDHMGIHRTQIGRNISEIQKSQRDHDAQR